jgi:hypothetical protein
MIVNEEERVGIEDRLGEDGKERGEYSIRYNNSI